MTVGSPCTVDRCIQGVKLALALPNDDARATRSVVLNLGLRLMDLSKFGARRAASSDPNLDRPFHLLLLPFAVAGARLSLLGRTPIVPDLVFELIFPGALAPRANPISAWRHPSRSILLGRTTRGLL